MKKKGRTGSRRNDFNMENYDTPFFFLPIGKVEKRMRVI